MKIVIVTGGDGYIGRAITHYLKQSGYRVMVIDRSFSKCIEDDDFKFDLTDEPYELIRKLRLSSKGDEFYSLIHMAAWKDLPGSYDNPLEYYRNNLFSTINAAEIAGSLGCKSIIFSSSAAVYSDKLSGNITEYDMVTGDSPYGYTKLVGERIIQDIANQFGMRSYSLRYQNPIGYIEGVTMDTSDSMFGNILNSLKYDKEFTIFGGDYPTEDGTCIRDYVSIDDIARAHIHFITYDKFIDSPINIGTGKGTSCLEVCQSVSELCHEFKYKIGDRRVGDAPGSYADITLLKSTGFECKDTIKTVIDTLIKYNHDRSKQSIIL